MSRPDPTARRPWLRALGVAAVLLLSAVAAHAAGGGPLPAAGALVVPAGLMVAVGFVLTGGPPPRGVSLAVVSGSQYVVHVLLGLSASRSHDMAGTSMTADMTADLAAGAGPASSDVTMLAMHAVGTLATALLLAQGDRVLGWLLVALRPAWQRRSVTLHPVGRPLRVPLADAPRAVPAAQRWVTGRPRRGPPRGAGVAPCVTA